MDPIALRYKQRSERYPDENEAERWHGVALGFYLRTGDVPQEVLQYKALALAGLYARKYREDQPRVPAGNPDGGQWTYDGGSNSQSGGEESDGGGGDDRSIEDENDAARAQQFTQLYERGYLLSERVIADVRLCRYVFSFGVVEGPGSLSFGCESRPFSSAVSHYRLLPLNDNERQKGVRYDHTR
jgi:hypothetical protein